MKKLFTNLSFCLLIIQPVVAQINFSGSNKSSSILLSRLDSAISAGTYERITSVLIAKNGELIFEKYYNGANINTKHNTRSATKTMATLLTGIAVKKGFIKSEKDKILDYLTPKKPLDDSRKESITIEDLLTMSSMMECNDWNSFSRGNEERMYLIEDWTQFFLKLPVRSYTFNLTPKESPYGRSFSYCSAGAATMAEVIQTAVRMNLDAFADKNLFHPLTIKDYKLDHTPKNILNTAGGSEFKSRDFLKLIQLCLNNGMWNGKEIIEKSWITKATTPKANIQKGYDYGYLFWLKSFGETKQYQSYYMSGNGGQKILALPELNVAVVITSTNYGNRKAHKYTDEIMNTFIVPAMDD